MEDIKLEKYCQNSECPDRTKTFPFNKMVIWEIYIFCSNKCRDEFINRFKERETE